MSVIFVCDRERCGAGALGIFDGHGWRPPAPWRSLILDDWEVHGCCDSCFEAATAEKTGVTPAEATRIWATVKGLRLSARSSFEVPQKPPDPSSSSP